MHGAAALRTLGLDCRISEKVSDRCEKCSGKLTCMKSYCVFMLSQLFELLTWSVELLKNSAIVHSKSSSILTFLRNCTKVWMVPRLFELLACPQRVSLRENVLIILRCLCEDVPMSRRVIGLFPGSIFFLYLYLYLYLSMPLFFYSCPYLCMRGRYVVMYAERERKCVHHPVLLVWRHVHVQGGKDS